jgi:hypothetical protein
MQVKISDSEILEAVKSSQTMAEAASKLGIHFNTFARLANKLGVYKPNQSGKGIKKPKKEGNGKIPLNEILEGKHPTYQTFKLKGRLFTEKLKTNICEECGTSEWNGKKLMCELDHINGNSRDHRLENLKILCPNCHSQTDTFRAKNKSKCI